MSVLITVGIIAKNEANYIATTLETLIEQNFDSLLYEIIVVDGNSKDNTREIAEEVLESSKLS